MMNGSDAAALGRNPSARAAGPRWAVLGRCSARCAHGELGRAGLK